MTGRGDGDAILIFFLSTHHLLYFFFFPTVASNVFHICYFFLVYFGLQIYAENVGGFGHMVVFFFLCC